MITASVTYTQSGNFNVWGTATYKLTGGGTGGQSNENIRLVAGGSTKWSYDSPDDRVNNTSYSKSLDSTRTAASDSEYVTFNAVFDVLGSDPSCTAKTKTV